MDDEQHQPLGATRGVHTALVGVLRDLRLCRRALLEQDEGETLRALNAADEALDRLLAEVHVVEP